MAVDFDTWNLWMSLCFMASILIVSYVVDSFLATLLRVSYPRVFDSFEAGGGNVVWALMGGRAPSTAGAAPSATVAAVEGAANDDDDVDNFGGMFTSQYIRPRNKSASVMSFGTKFARNSSGASNSNMTGSSSAE